MVDSVKVYTKLKESFNWPDDSDDSPDSTMAKAPAPGSNVSSSETATEGTTSAAVTAPAPLTSMDRYVAVCLLVVRFHCCYILRESQTTQNVLWSCSSVYLSVHGHTPTLLHGPRCNLEAW